MAHRILKNGVVWTMTEQERVTAVAMDREGRILAVGSDTEVLNLATPDTEIRDLRGKTLLPGFFDCHLHLLWLGENLGHVNLAPPSVRTKEEIVRRLRERLAENPNAPIIQGANYDQNALLGAQHLTRGDLDSVSKEIPVRIVHASGHAAVINSKALELLGIAKETPNPLAGEIVRDASGEPTGVLLETASWMNLERILPDLTETETVEALGRASDYLIAQGITSASDANTALRDIALYERAAYENRLQIRVNSMVAWAEVMQNVGEGRTPRTEELQPTAYGVNGHRYHVGQAKLFSDGAVTTRTCWLKEPFLGMPDNYGIPNHAPEELTEYICRAHRAGWQVATHAIGDRAIDVVLMAYAEAQRRYTRPRPGHRIEHAMLLDTDLIARMRRQNIWSVGQPEFLSRLGDAYLLALGEERSMRLSPYATLEAQNVAQVFSSDCPVVPGAPLDGIRAALERKTPKGFVLNAAERVSVETAFFAYTSAPASATRTDIDRGVIEEGMWADFVLLSQDPRKTPVEEWEALQVEATFVAGDCLYERSAM